MEWDNGKQEATVIEKIIGNVFVGSVKGDTAKELSEQFGKINQKKQSVTTTSTGTGVSISTQLDHRIPQSVMAELSQRHFVGAVADSLGEEIGLKVCHAKTIINEAKIKTNQSSFVDIPHLNQTLFKDKEGNDRTEEVIESNYYWIRQDVKIKCFNRNQIEVVTLSKYMIFQKMNIGICSLKIRNNSQRSLKLL